MNKTAIQKFAVWARGELLAQVKQRAYNYGVTAQGCADADADAVGGRALAAREQALRRELVDAVQSRGYDAVAEEAAYTWFNRFAALRYMEVNDYLPTHVRVFSNAAGAFEPEILREALHLDLPGLDRARVAGYIERNETEALYRYLLLTQCNALGEALPQLFEPIAGYTALLCPGNLLRPDSVPARMVADIPEADWTDQVQIIGWLYQYYNAEVKDETFALLKKNVKITKERLPSATQLFTPDWIVRYMVENSLGRLYVEGQLAAAGPLTEAARAEKEQALAAELGWRYYLPEAAQEPQVRAQLDRLTAGPAALPELKVIDPCMGSGHILVYAFEVLMQLYEREGWNPRDAAQSILEHNLYGLDIDGRAAQLAYFAVMMKARRYDRRILGRGIQPHVCAIRESNALPAEALHALGAALPDGERAAALRQAEQLVQVFCNAREYGSILTVPPLDWALLRRLAASLPAQDSVSLQELRARSAAEQLRQLIAQGEMMARQYDVVVTNPPYMGSSGMNAKLADFVKKNYPDSKSDLFAVFIERCGQMTAPGRYQAMITQHAWMFLSSYEKLRGKLLRRDTASMAHLGPRAFEEIGGEVVQTTSFVLRASHTPGYKGTYCRLIEPTTQQGKEELFLSGASRYIAQQDNFAKIPGAPVAYWVSEGMLRDFSLGHPLSEIAYPRQGMATTNNNLFLRQWFEVCFKRIGFNFESENDTLSNIYKWFPYNKGGEFRRWYGNNDYVVNFQNKGADVCAYIDSHSAVDHKGRVINRDRYFKPSVTWSKISSGSISFRYKPKGFIFDVAGTSIFGDNTTLWTLMAFLNSKVTLSALKCLSPTLNYEVGQICTIPIIAEMFENISILQIAKLNGLISKSDWDSYETSWDFKKHPLV